MARLEVPVRDLMERTMDNLLMIDALHERGQGGYEVTQLVNSFLGALAHPWEAWEHAFQRRAGRQERFADWPVPKTDDERDIQLPHFGEVLKKLRNAMANGNVEFLADPSGDIAKIRLWNVTPDGFRDWGTTLTIAELREILERFVEFARTLPEPHRRPPKHVSERPIGERCRACGQFPRSRPARG